MADEESLRINFCSMILQAKGEVIANFVAWLDLKVAEYKVYGHMILTDRDDNSAAWSYSANTDPSVWPRSKQGGEMQFTNTSFGMQQSSNVGASQPRSYSGLSVNRRALPATVARRGRGNMRVRPARPKSVVANLLKNAISRSTKAPVTSTPLAQPSTSTRTTVADASQSITDSSTTTHTEGGATIKTEDGNIVTLDSDSEAEDIKPNISDTGDASLWLNESAGSMDTPDMSGVDSASSSLSYPMSGAAIPNVSQGIVTTLPHSPAHVMTRPVHKAITPRAGPSTATSQLKQLVPKRTPGGRDSVSELLETHTVQTDSGYQCNLCSSIIRTWSNMRAHMRQQHSNITFRCIYCRRMFNRADRLRLHIEKHHGCKETL